jgi:hypothetical protein
MYHRYLLYQPEMGVYLGEFMGMGFWSLLDPVGQTMATVFNSKEAISDYVGTWESPVSDLAIWEIDTAHPNFATMAEIEALGLPGWSVE